jgi:Domain of unknown function (DUF4926)
VGHGELGIGHWIYRFETKQMIKLFKEQIGTVVMEFDGSAFEVEFSQ